ncbi:lipopolysaccharide heptosyltransferase II [Pontiella agarivorans]|uniref:lipopolysaccharide heptosyltransferase II n=1 Tax=Pontiella agarivorans TaxID=3038953 RepID=A0ABU5MTC0_9BACT|nr:lipopolysaccharide heptosyltransferase II [Pontiella agarivorans]MDZ8117470.1 lipopolysaccharide heptosyltransferase II [Pontiella agarivorans]
MAERILIMGLNWIGDAVMSMPAIQACRHENPDAHIGILVKPYLKPFWEMHAAPDRILTLDSMGGAIREIRDYGFEKAFILPNSFRSALIPMLAGVQQRIGFRGDHRRLMLTDVVPVAGGHQSNEYFPIVAPKSVDLVKELPELNVPDEAFQTLERKFPNLERYVVLMPGAARGASKMWPLGHFEQLSRMLLDQTDLRLVFAGGSGDAPACEELAEKLGGRTESVAGRTSLKEWAALLKNAKLAVANDSGGMHLAGAVGTPVVGIYGLTDPEKTGPLARKFRVIQNSTIKSRDIARNSDEAVKTLESITPEQVMRSAAELMV